MTKFLIIVSLFLLRKMYSKLLRMKQRWQITWMWLVNSDPKRLKITDYIILLYARFLFLLLNNWFQNAAWTFLPLRLFVETFCVLTYHSTSFFFFEDGAISYPSYHPQDLHRQMLFINPPKFLRQYIRHDLFKK